MGREVRRVPPGWEHPRDEAGRYVPLFDGAKLAEAVAYYEVHEAEWRAEYGDDLGGEERPDPAEYAPAWSPEEATAWCIYENVSEGTPWSPVVSDPEALQAWLVEVHGYDPGAAARFLID